MSYRLSGLGEEMPTCPAGTSAHLDFDTQKWTCESASGGGIGGFFKSPLGIATMVGVVVLGVVMLKR